MASAISNVDIAIWAETSGGPHPECPSVCAREARNRQVWSGILRHAGSRLRLWENVGHDARGETCRPGEREVGAVERTHNFMCSKPLDSRFLRISFYWRRAACGSSGLSAPSSSSAARHVRPWRRAWVVNREELFIMIHRIRSYAVVGSRDAQEKQTSLPQNSMRAPRSSPCKQPFTGPSRTRTLRSFALAKSPVRLTSSPKLIGCESSASLSAPTRFGAMQREQAAPHALS